jgi:hypothetical protein
MIPAHCLLERSGFFSREPFLIYFFRTIVIRVQCVASVRNIVMVHDFILHALFYTICMHITNIIVLKLTLLF